MWKLLKQNNTNQPLMNKQFIDRINLLEDRKDIPVLTVELLRAKGNIEQERYIADALCYLTKKTYSEVMEILNY